ncbi:TetR/AcrR family transcriptional regulator [Streptomyces uncialis]|uniref:TetR/AcrR family transcriptional regulator n=1 Tax=Streptomyces uncialis TaxID=1048205 RepID=UPI0036492FB0
MGEVPPRRPLRADAERNRLLLLQAAREVFAERGLEATLDDVARHAGVGVGTVYRRFANKEELMDAVLRQKFADIVSAANQSRTQGDAWDALTGFFEYACERMSMDRGLMQMLNRVDDHCGQVEQQRGHLEEVIEDLVRRAQHSGALRPDAVAGDFIGVIFMVSAVIEFTGSVAPGAWQRYLALLLDGLRGDGPPRNPLPLPAPTIDDLHEARRTSRAPKRPRKP